MNISQPSLSALTTAATRLDIAANDIANINTKGYEEQVAHQEPIPSGGVRISHVSKTPNPNKDVSNTDIVSETYEVIQSKHAFAANAEVIKTKNDMIGQLIDIFR